MRIQIGTAFLKLNLEYLVKLHMDLAVDSAISLLGLYPKDILPQILEQPKHQNNLNAHAQERVE